MNPTHDLPRLFRGPISGLGRETVWRCVPAVIYLLAIHTVSSVPGDELPILIDDRVAHFLQYFGLSVLLHLAASGLDRVGRPWIVAAAVVSFAAVWAILDEVHQSFVPGRDASVKDVVFDVAGATTAALLVRWYAWRNVVR